MANAPAPKATPPAAPTVTRKPAEQPPATEPPSEQPPAEEEQEAEAQPFVERVNMAGLVLEKTVHPDGECETRTLQEPTIAPELIRATRASQRRRGH